ncbi:MAG: hypothetical protein B7X02_02840, partial [Rhodospirillales bacterium 12-54-5]
GRADYGNWELSADRANAARRFLLKNGVDAQQPKRVGGTADKELAYPKQPRDARNRRITIIMLKGSHLLIPDAAAPESPGATVAPDSKAALTTNPNGTAPIDILGPSGTPAPAKNK